MAIVNITVQNDADFYRTFIWQTIAGAPIDLTGGAMEMMLRRHATDKAAGSCGPQQRHRGNEVHRSDERPVHGAHLARYSGASWVRRLRSVEHLHPQWLQGSRLVWNAHQQCRGNAMTEVQISNDIDVNMATSDSAVIVIFDSETEVIQTFEQGPPGPPGIGIQGPQGPDGEDGTAVLYGVTDPPSTLGVNGDFYINTTTHFIFGPKAGTWPAGTSLIGPQGPQGIQGIQGPAGLTLLLGDTPPVGAPDNSLWYETDTGLTYVRYNDGNTTQWVIQSRPDAGSANTVQTIPQTLTTAQQLLARQNIAAAPFDAMGYFGMQVNGAFEVSQEKGVNGTVGSGYVCDMWNAWVGGTMGVTWYPVTSNQGYGPFSSLMTLNVQTAQAVLGAGDYAYVQQAIEGWRMARLMWGSSYAKPITISFWSQHHRTGLWSGCVGSAGGGGNRSYAFTYTQNVADVPEYKTVTIPGDQAAGWTSITNAAGMYIMFAVAAGASDYATAECPGRHWKLHHGAGGAHQRAVVSSGRRCGPAMARRVGAAGDRSTERRSRSMHHAAIRSGIGAVQAPLLAGSQAAPSAAWLHQWRAGLSAECWKLCVG